MKNTEFSQFDPNNERPSSSISQTKLFDSQSINDYTEEFVIDSSDVTIDSVFADSTPGLIALHRKTSKIRRDIKTPSSNATMSKIEKHFTGQTMLKPRLRSKIPSLASNTVFLNQREYEKELNSLQFSDDPVSYFFKHKDGTGHMFIYMIYEKSRNDPDFSPYELKKVPHSDIGTEFFTMSANIVTKVLPDGNTDSISLENWCREASIFSGIRKLKFFKLYFFWKTFKIWRRFLQKERFLKISKQVNGFTMFSNQEFAESLINIRKDSCDSIIKNYLLCFSPQQKYTLNEFKTAYKNNFEKLSVEFSKYIGETIEILLNLDYLIRDPSKIEVTESDLYGKRNKVPDLGYLLETQDLITKEKGRRSALMHEEILSFGNFVRLVDYIILEDLQKACLDSWRFAKEQISQEMCAIFQIELNFANNGALVFAPSLDQLVENIKRSLEDSILCVDSLPMIRASSALRPHLRETYSDFMNLLTFGPSIRSIIFTNSEFSFINRSIISVIEQSYSEAEVHSQGFKAFYNIFQIGKSWNPLDYIHPRGGESFEFNFADYASDFDRESEIVCYNPSTEPIIDFSTIRNDVERFKKEEVSLNQFRACTVRGAIYIDSKSLRSKLTPIPAKSMQSLNYSLKELLSKRIERINSIFRFCSKRLKKEPSDLLQFVSNIEFIFLVKKITFFISNEIDFSNDLYSLLESFGLGSTSIDHMRSPLRGNFKQFLTDQTVAIAIKEEFEKGYTIELNNRVMNMYQQLLLIKAKVKDFPVQVESIDVDQVIKGMGIINVELLSIQHDIGLLSRFQRVLSVDFADLSIYEEIRSEIDFLLELYQASKDWHNIKTIIFTVPFNSINISEFSVMVQKMDLSLHLLSKGNRSFHPLLENLKLRLNNILPFLDELELLSNSKMLIHHWNKLFDECGQSNAYYAQIRIDELITLGILQRKEQIETISITAQGEARLESEYQSLLHRWKEIRLPILPNPKQIPDTLVLGNTYPILAEIYDSQLQIHRMLSVPFVIGLKDSIMSLSSSLEHFAQVLEVWKVFQSNWSIVSTFFLKSDSSEKSNSLAAQFNIVKRRWISLLRHSLDDTSLFNVCSFPSILEMLKENNLILENLLSGILKYIDNKRLLFPRLFFLCDDDVLTLFSTNSFEVFSRIISCVFMNVKGFNTNYLEQSESDIFINDTNSGFGRIRVYSMVGITGDILHFSKGLAVTSSTESWCNTLVDTMKSSMHSILSDCYHGFFHSSIHEWIMNFPFHIVIISLYAVFSRDIDECFNNFENNVHTFKNYEKTLSNRVKSVLSLVNKEMKWEIIQKLSSIISLLSYQIELTSCMSQRIPNYSQRQYWMNYLKLRYNHSNSSMSIEFNSQSYTFGYEFWGSIKPFIMLKSSENQVQSVLASILSSSNPYVLGQSGSGRKKLMSTLASLFGKFICFSPSYQEKSSVSILRYIAGAASTGSWILILGIDKCNPVIIKDIYLQLLQICRIKQENSRSFLFGNHNLLIDESFSIVFTGSNCFQSFHLPDALSSVLQPVFLLSPEVNLLAKTKLLSLGFRFSSEIARSVVSIVKYTLLHYNTLPFQSSIGFIFKIIESASKLLLRSINIEYNYPSLNDDLLKEEFFIAKSTYTHLNSIINPDSIESFFVTLHFYFPVFDDMLQFKESIICDISQLENSESDIVYNIGTMLCENSSLRDYLVRQAKQLFFLLNTYRCVIIYGPPNSGKSTMLKFLSEMYTHLGQSFQSLTLFQSSDPKNKIFGKMENGKDGPSWSFGMIHSFLKNMLSNDSDQNSILCLNGPIDRELFYIIESIVASNDEPDLNLSSFTKMNNDKIHIIIETDSIRNISPDILSYVGLLPMKHIGSNNTEQGCLSSIFDRSSRKNNLYLSEYYKVYLHVFLDIAPQILDYIDSGILDYHEKCQSTPFLLTHEIIDDILLERILLFAFQYFIQSHINENSESQFRIILLHSFFLIYGSVLPIEKAVQFDFWIRKQFHIDLPSDWVGFHVTEEYWNTFPRPSFQSVYYSENKFKPFSYSISDLLPIPLRHFESQNLSHDDFVVNCPIFLPIFFTLKIAFAIKQHVLLYGPLMSGKKSLLRLFFEKETNIIPVYIPITKSSTGQSLLSYMSLCTSLTSKKSLSQESNNVYALIFEGITSDNVYAMEFIRMIVTTGTIYKCSERDPKILNQIQLSNMVVIAISNDNEVFPARFVSNFIPIRLKEPSGNQKKHIFSQISKNLGFSSSFLQYTYQLIDGLQINGKTFFHYLSFLEVLVFYENHSKPIDSDNLEFVRALLSEIRYFYTHKLVTVDENRSFNTLYQKTFTNPHVRACYGAIFNGNVYVYPEIETNDEGKINANFTSHQPHLVREELEFMLNHFRSQTGYQSSLLFFRPIIDIWIFLNRSLSIPGKNIIIQGREGSGRFSLSFFTSFSLGNIFYQVKKREKIIKKKQQINQLCSDLSSIIQKCLFENKKSVVFIDYVFCTYSLPLLSHLYQFYDIFPFFSEEGLQGLITKYISLNKIQKSDFLTVISLISMDLKKRLHFILKVNENFDRMLFYRFDLIRISNHEVGFYQQCAEDFLLLEKVQTFLTFKTNDFARSISRIYLHASSAIGFDSPLLFYDFLSVFKKVYLNKITSARKKNEYISRSVDFITSIESKVQDINVQISQIEPQIHVSDEEENRKFSEIDAKRETLKARLARIEKLIVEKTTVLNQFEEELLYKKSKIIQNKANIDLSVQKLIGNPHQSIIKVIEYSNLAPVVLIIECMCLLFGFPSKMDPYGKKLLNDPKILYQTVLTMNYNTISERVLSLIRDRVDSLKLSDTNISEFSPVLGDIHQWIFDSIEYAKSLAEIDEYEKEFNSKSKTLKSQISDANIEKDSIYQVREAIDDEAQQLHTQVAKISVTKNGLSNLISKRGQYFVLLDGLDVLDNRWLSIASSFNEIIEIIFGDSVLIAFYISFYSLCNSEIMNELIIYVQEELLRSSVKFSDKTIFEQTFVWISLFDFAKGLIYSDNSVSLDTQLDFLIMDMAIRPPLIIDPDGIIIGILKKGLKPSSFVEVSMYSSKLFDVLEMSIETGKQVLITDVNYHNPILSELLAIESFSPNSTQKILFGSRIIEKSHKFKMFLSSSLKNPNLVPIDLRSRTKIIDTSYSNLSSIKDILLKEMTKIFDQDNLMKLSDLRSIKISKQIRLSKSEIETLEILNNISLTLESTESYDFLSDTDAFSGLIRAKASLLGVLNDRLDYDSFNNQIKEITNPYMKIVDQEYYYWISISRYYSQISGFRLMSFDSFVENMVHCLRNIGVCDLSKQESKKIRKMLCHSFLSYILPDIPISHGLYLLFVIVYLKQCNNIQVTSSLFDDIVSHWFNELFSNLDMRSRDISSIESVSQARYLNIGSVFPFIIQLLTNEFGESFDNYFSYLKVTSILSTKPSIPVIIDTQGQTEVFSIVDTYLRTIKSYTYKSYFLFIDNGWYSRIIQEIRLLIINGGIVLLILNSSSSDYLSFLMEIYELIQNPNPDFRLVIITSNQISLPYAYNKCKYLHFENLASIRIYMQQVYGNHQSISQIKENSHLYHRIRYGLTYLFSVFKLKYFNVPMGFSYIENINETNIRRLSEIIFSYVSSFPNQDAIPIRNIVEFIHSVVSTSISDDTYDHIRIYNDIEIVFGSGLLEGKKVFANMRIVNRESWAGNEKDDQKVFDRTILSMPIFSGFENLYESKSIPINVKNWNLSRWLIRTFTQSFTPKLSLHGFSAKLDSLLVMFPSEISSPFESGISPLTHFLLEEIHIFNSSLRKVKMSISERVKTVIDKLALDYVPQEWLDYFGFGGVYKIVRFISLIQERHKFINDWIKNGNTNHIIDVRCIHNLKGFLESYMIEIAIRKSIDPRMLVFATQFETEHSDLCLNGISIVAANFDISSFSITIPNQKSTLISKLPSLYVSVSSSNIESQDIIQIPLFYEIPNFDRQSINQQKKFDQENMNCIMNISIKSSMSRSEIIQSGTICVCHLPDSLVE